jgi:hypothetical protein
MRRGQEVAMNPHDPRGNETATNIVPFGAPHDGADNPAFETRLRAALQVPVPEGLAERILLAQTTEVRGGGHAGPRRARPWVWRAAAGLVLAVGALGLFFGVSQPVTALPALAIDHTLNHIPPERAGPRRIAPSQVRALFAQRGVILDEIPADVHYASVCDLGPVVALHLISAQPDGSVEIYFVPGSVDPMRMDFRRGGLAGRSVPLATGTLILLSRDNASFDRLEQVWTPALTAGR